MPATTRTSGSFSKLMSFLTFAGKSVAVLVLVLAILIAVISNSCSCRRSFFAQFMRSRDTTKHTEWTDTVMCPHILSNGTGLKGTVVDLGTGAGSSLLCYQNSTGIDKLYLVEPMAEFRKDLEDGVAFWLAHLRDKIEIVTSGGQALNQFIKPNTVDTVVSVHLLCSVDNHLLNPIVEQVGSILKPGGEWRLIEHTTDPDESSFNYKFQMFIAPLWEIIGNGCKFLNFPSLFRRMFSADLNSKISNSERHSSTALGVKELVEFRYPLIRFLPFSHPHVRGVAQKPLVAAAPKPGGAKSHN